MYTRARTFFSFFSGIVAGRKVKSSDLVKRVFVVVCVCVYVCLVLKTVTQHAFLLCCGRWKLRLGRCRRTKNGMRDARGYSSCDSFVKMWSEQV
jgi:hypothetical protein